MFNGFNIEMFCLWQDKFIPIKMNFLESALDRNLNNKP